jgi:hypothetical protein
MRELLATYILALQAAAEATRFASDRPLYQMYLAEAAVLLARVIEGASVSELLPFLRGHERTRGQTWIQGGERDAADAAWEAVVGHTPGVRAP